MRGFRVLSAALSAVSLAAQGVDAPKPGGLAGVAVESKSGAPVPKATVILRGKQDAGIGTTTDASGVFTFRDLEPDTYQITVERAGYVTAPESQRKTVTVKAGETVSDFKLTLLRTGVISGRAFDTDGEPLARVSIQISPQRKGARGGLGAVTNDLGEYRAFDIAPGKYRIAASYSPGPALKIVRMQPSPRPDGRVVHEAYQTVYYPGTVDPAQSIALNVEPGAELRGIDFRMVRTSAVRVSGRVTGPTGLFTAIGLDPSQQDEVGEGRNAVVTPKGEFELEDVLPGAYWLTATAGGLDSASRFVTRRLVQVGDQDVEGIQLALGAGQTLTGRLIAPEGRQLPRGLVVVLQSRDGNQAGGFGQVAADGAFSLRNVGPGDYDAVLGSTESADDDLYISAMRMGDTDALADGVHIGEAAAEPLNIVFKSNGASVACIVKDDKGAPIPAAHVLLVPAAPKTQRFALHAECTTGADGACRMNGVTPGDYHAYALAGDTQVNRRDSDLFKSVESNGKAMTLAEGQQEKIELTLMPAE